MMKKKMRKWNGKRILSIGLALVLCFSCMDVTAFAAEPDSVEERQESAQETLTDVSDGVESRDKTSEPGDGKTGEDTQNPDGKKDGENAQNPDEGNGAEDGQNPEEGKAGDNPQNPDEGKDGEGAQTPEEGNGGEGAQNPSDGEDDVDDPDAAEQEPDAPDGEEMSGTDDQESVSENNPDEQEPSVSENDMEVLGEVRALAVPVDAIDSGTYGNITWVVDADGKLTVEGTGEFYASGASSIPWYNHRNKIKSAVIKLKKTTKAQSMFDGCSNLTYIDMSEFDTSEVTNMSRMFYGCGQLKNLDISNFDTAAVITMENMFYGCWGLTELDLSGFQTDNVNNMVGMFNGCSELIGLDLNSFKTDNVSNMSRMFQHCRKLKSLKVDRFDTGKVTDMSYMFDGCGGLTSLNVSSFNTSNVTDMTDMFNACSALTGLDVSNFDTGNVTTMSGMFSDCVGMDTIDLSAFDTGKVTSMTNMFYTTGLIGHSGYGDGFKQLDLSSFDTSRVTGMAGMFEGQENLIELDLNGFDTSQVTSMRRMFMYCYSLPELNLSSFDTGKVTDMINMFYECRALKSLDLSHFNLETHTVGTGSKELGLFSGCRKLTVLYTPCNLKAPLTCHLPSENSADSSTIHWYDMAGTEYQYLPRLSYSILLQRDQKPDAVQNHITARKARTGYICGETIALDDLTVTCYEADGSVRKLTPEQYTTNVAQIDMTEAGEKKLVVTYVNGGTRLTAEITLTVTYGLTAANTTVTLPVEDYTYDGLPKQPVPTAVSYMQNAAGGEETPVTLTAVRDYTVSYRNNINAYEPSVADGSGAASGTGAGTAAAPTVIIRGVGEYSGTVTQTFAIRKAEAPAAETMDVISSQCAQANPNRTIDLTGSFKACGKKTGYEIVSVEDTKSIFSKTPVTADIRNGVLTYGTNVAQEGDTASIKVKVSFANYKDAELTVRITMAAKRAAVISGITMKESVVYSGAPVTYGGEAAVKTEDGKDITGQVSLVYQYSGVMADGMAYPAQSGTAEPPVNAGNYLLTVSVNDDNPDYVGSVSYPFTIRKADAAVTARDMVVLMQLEGEGSALVPVDQYQKDFGYTVTGLFSRDALTKEPSYKVTEDEAGTKTVTAIDTSKAGTYYIHPSGADAGMNYELAYKPGILAVSEERVVYTVTLDGMGHCDTFTKSGIKSGALLELTERERTPAAKEKGYVFAGWYKDRTFAKGKEWDFDADTVQSDLTLYACWLTAAGEDGNGLKLYIQEIPDLTYTGTAQKPAVTVYDSDGTTLLKSGRDYTVKYVRNTDAVAVDEEGRSAETGGIAKVTNPGKANEQLTDVVGHFSKNCPYVVITGKGNYAETVYRNFLILPAQISAADADGKAVSGNLEDGGGDTPLAAGFTMKYTDQFEAKANKTAKIVSSIKYKKALKVDKDYSVSVVNESGQNVSLAQGKIPLNAGVYTMTVTGKGNYAGVVRRKLYVAEKKKLMKNVSIVLGRNQKTHAYTGEDVLLTPGYNDAGTKKNYKVSSEGVVDSTPEDNANDLFLVKNGKESLIWGKDYTIDYTGTNRAVGTATMTLTGKNGYVGKKSVTFRITGTAFSAKTIDVKEDDGTKPDGKDWKASLPYSGKALTQSQVTLTTKVTQKSPVAQKLTYGEHYTISYKNNVKKGTATVIFTAKPESGYSGSFKKTFKITAQELSKERLTITPQGRDMTASGETVRTGVAGKTAVPEAVYCKNGAKLPFVITNEVGTVLREGTDYTVKYKNNNAVTTAQMPENRKPLMTVTGKGNYAGTVEVPFAIVQASLASALDEGIVQVSCAQVQKKNGMKLKDLKFKLVEGKKTLGMGGTKDYVIDETGCTPEILKAYADAVAAGTALPEEPVVKVTGQGYYTGEKTIALGRYIYADKLTASYVYVVVSEGAGQSIYTGGQVTPDVAVYYGEKTAVSAAKKDKVKEEMALTAQSGKYKLTKLAEKPSENAGNGGNAGNAKDGDYTVSYGANIAAGKNKGSVTVTGAGRYGGSVTVKFEIGKKAIY